MSLDSNEITITLTTLSGQTESINVSSDISPMELREFAIALLGGFGSTTFDSNNNNDGDNDNVSLTRYGEILTESSRFMNGDVVLVSRRGEGMMMQQQRQRRRLAQQTQQVRIASGTGRQVRGSLGGGGGGGGRITGSGASSSGGLDFTNLLSGAGVVAGGTAGGATGAGGRRAPSSALSSSASSSSSSSKKKGTGGLSFNLPSPNTFVQSSPVEWDGMSLDDAVRSNPNPDHFVSVLLDETKHPNLMKELNYHSPNLAKKIREAGVRDGARIWREEMMKGSIQSAYASTMSNRKQSEMEERLRINPHDEEANKYFGNEIRRKNVDSQYRQMMEEYPESMGRVLMLYIDAEVNGYAIQAFVDSGAQSTIMSSACAEKCGLLHLLDERFEGTAVGVGTGKILGRVHIAPLKVGGHYFPCTITVMDSEQGLGDKNMDFLFGLDMLKRHRCKIDLERNCLFFTMENGTHMEAPFLHEKDLDEKKGGTKGFDAEKSNAELERRMKEAVEEKEGQDDDNLKRKGTTNHGDTNGTDNETNDEENGNNGGEESEIMDVDETDRENEEVGKKAKKNANGGS